MTFTDALDRLMIWVLFVVLPLSAGAYAATLNLLKDTPIVVCTMPDGDCDPIPEENNR